MNPAKSIPSRHWQVNGADAQTGREMTIELEAPTELDATELANRRGMLVSSVRGVLALAGSVKPRNERTRGSRTWFLVLSVGAAVAALFWIVHLRRSGPRWEAEHRAQIMAMEQEGKGHEGSGRKNQAVESYTRLLDLVANRKLKDGELRAAVAEAQERRIVLQQRLEAEERALLALQRQKENEKRQQEQARTREMAELRVWLKSAEPFAECLRSVRNRLDLGIGLGDYRGKVGDLVDAFDRISKPTLDSRNKPTQSDCFDAYLLATAALATHKEILETWDWRVRQEITVAESQQNLERLADGTGIAAPRYADAVNKELDEVQKRSLLRAREATSAFLGAFDGLNRKVASPTP
jgi:hypothetical protein